jgi:hypothetical protein
MAQTAEMLREALKTPHWSTKIPLDTPHPRLGALAEQGYVVLRDLDPPIDEHEYLGLEYMDWKSGGDTNFAPIATASSTARGSGNRVMSDPTGEDAGP